MRLGHLDPAFLARVRAAYMRSYQDLSLDSMWGGIDRVTQAQVHLAMRDDNTMRAMFADPASTELFYGVDNITKTTVELFKGADMAADQRSRLAALAKQMGNEGLSPEQIFSIWDAALGHRIEFPNPFRGEVGLPTERGLANVRATQGVYQTWRVAELLKESRSASIFEIGPGMGRAAYYAYRAGMTDYTTVDLPLGIVRQACFLGATLGPDALWFAGEPPAQASGRIKLLCANDPLPERRYSIVVSSDNLTEMPLAVAVNYLRWIERHADIFYSINHARNQFTVTDLAKRMEWRLVQRQPNLMWLENSTYVDEVYEFDGSHWHPRLAVYVWAHHARHRLRSLQTRATTLATAATKKRLP